jgi:DNA-binding MarR family transcriptional regulator
VQEQTVTQATSATKPDWTLLTYHAFVLLEVHRNPNATVREIAEPLGLTERQTHRILNDLCAAQYVERERVGRRNRYRVHPELPLRHAAIAHHRVEQLLGALARR